MELVLRNFVVVVCFLVFVWVWWVVFVVLVWYCVVIRFWIWNCCLVVSVSNWLVVCCVCSVFLVF